MSALKGRASLRFGLFFRSCENGDRKNLKRFLSGDEGITGIKHRMSKIFQPSLQIPFSNDKKKAKESAAIEEDEERRGHKLLVNQGIIRGVPTAKGIYHFLPLGQRSLNKVIRIIDEELEKIDCQRIQMPLVSSKELWTKTGRWETMGSEMFKLEDRNNRHFSLNPTHEESITSLMAETALSYKNLPLRLYQIGPKYRDEMMPKFGLIRAREFVMQDLYTFDKNEADSRETYEAVTSAYDSIFARLGVPWVRVEGETGAIGGTVSHEYHFPSPIGQDDLEICSSCGRGANAELDTKETLISECERNCEGKFMKTSKGVEIGHTFLLGQKYSKPLKANFTGIKGKPEILEMGCYGIGVSRIIGAAAEILSKENRLRWPREMAPFKVVILAPKPGSKQFEANSKAEDLCRILSREIPGFEDDVLFDDRADITVGKKLRDARNTGIPFIVLFGKESVNPGGDEKVEFYELKPANFEGEEKEGEEQPELMSIQGVIQKLKNFDFGPNDIAVVREVYDGEQSEDIFRMELERALEVGCRTIVIEPTALASEISSWLRWGTRIRKASLALGLSTFVVGTAYPDREAFTISLAAASAATSALYLLSWYRDPASKYRCEVRKRSSMSNSNLSSGPLVLVRKDRPSGTTFVSGVAFTSLAFAFFKLR